MSAQKNKEKKISHKKNQVHSIPIATTAKGRRPYKEEASVLVEPYQPSLLSDLDLQPQNKTENRTIVKGSKVDFKVPDEISLKNSSDVLIEESIEEVILEGAPAPELKSSKIDLKEQIENVIGVVQMGTAIVKSSFPKPFEIADKVLEDWKQDGDFSELPISQPLVQFYLGLGLRKAKKTEKDLEHKLESTGVLPVVRQQWQKAQKLFK